MAWAEKAKSRIGHRGTETQRKSKPGRLKRPDPATGVAAKSWSREHNLPLLGWNASPSDDNRVVTSSQENMESTRRSSKVNGSELGSRGRSYLKRGRAVSKWEYRRQGNNNKNNLWKLSCREFNEAVDRGSNWDSLGSRIPNSHPIEIRRWGLRAKARERRKKWTVQNEVC